MVDRHFIKAWRKAKGLSQQRLADEVTERVREYPLPTELADWPSWGRTDVVKYEGGARDPPMMFINGMAIVMGCRPGDILNGPPGTPSEYQRELSQLPAEEQAIALRLLKAAKGQ